MKRVLTALMFLAGCGSPNERVVLYCAQDRPFAEAVFGEFEKQNRLGMAVKYDSEANKSIGLFRELQLEAKRPRCDVHWNNERICDNGVQSPIITPDRSRPDRENQTL
jgi:iron(III) transport system substrate-binding protein